MRNQNPLLIIELDTLHDRLLDAQQITP